MATKRKRVKIVNHDHTKGVFKKYVTNGEHYTLSNGERQPCLWVLANTELIDAMIADLIEARCQVVLMNAEKTTK